MTAPASASDPPAPDAAAYWRRNLRITGALLAVWFVVTFVATYFARQLRFSFFGWPFGFWVAGQGALLVYLLLIGLYARAMNRLERELGVDDGDGDGHG
jgi:putative solute:sodium symporter small subunit